MITDFGTAMLVGFGVGSFAMFLIALTVSLQLKAQLDRIRRESNPTSSPCR